MRIILFIFLHLTVIQSHANGIGTKPGHSSASFDFKCVNKMPMTSFILKTEGEFAVLTTIHHNGTPFMPIHEGIIVPRDINYLTDVASVLTLMGDRNEFKFPLEKCKLYGVGQMSCARGNSQEFQGREMQALNLYTTRIKESLFGLDFERTKVTLSVLVSNFVPVQDIMMVYEDGECEMDF